MAALAAFVYSAAPWAGLAVVVLAFGKTIANKNKPPALLRWTNNLSGHTVMLVVMLVAGTVAALPLIVDKPPSADEVKELRSVYRRMEGACAEYLLTDQFWESMPLGPPQLAFTRENYLRVLPAVEADYKAFAQVMREAVNGGSSLPGELRTLVQMTDREMRDNQTDYAGIARLPDSRRFAAQVRAPLGTVRVLCDEVAALNSELPLQ